MAEPKWPPRAGWIVSCYFPHEERVSSPGPDPRPVLIVEVHEDGRVLVAYGTAQGTSGTVSVREDSPYEIEIDPTTQEHAISNLKEQTRFNFRKSISLPYTSKWFPCVDGRSSPQIGSLPEMMRTKAKEAKKRAADMLAKKPALRFGSQQSKPEITIVKKKTKPLLAGDQNVGSGKKS